MTSSQGKARPARPLHPAPGSHAGAVFRRSHGALDSHRGAPGAAASLAPAPPPPASGSSGGRRGEPLPRWCTHRTWRIFPPLAFVVACHPHTSCSTPCPARATAAAPPPAPTTRPLATCGPPRPPGSKAPNRRTAAPSLAAAAEPALGWVVAQVPAKPGWLRSWAAHGRAQPRRRLCTLASLGRQQRQRHQQQRQEQWRQQQRGRAAFGTWPACSSGCSRWAWPE